MSAPLRVGGFLALLVAVFLAAAALGALLVPDDVAERWRAGGSGAVQHDGGQHDGGQHDGTRP